MPYQKLLVQDKLYIHPYLKFKQRDQPLRVCGQNGTNGIANSDDPDQTAPGSALFAKAFLSENLGSLRYT